MSPALAPARAIERVHSFAGSCSLHGPVTFSPPLTNSQQLLTVFYDGSGTCTGTLDGNRISNTPIKLQHGGLADGSCLHANTTGPGHGTITFADGTRIDYSFEFTFVTTEGEFTLRGKRSGAARGHGSFLTPDTPPDTALKCGAAGNPVLPMDMSLTTDSPLVSGASHSRR